MPRSPILTVAVCAAICAGCSRIPDSVPPPPQRAALAAVPDGIALGAMFAIGDPDARVHILRGVHETGEATWRWTDGHALLRFYVPDVVRARFLLDFTLPPVTFRQTGPVTLDLRLNGEPLDRIRYDTPGEQHYARDVPAALLRKNSVNEVAIDSTPIWVSPDDRQPYGVILVRAGFAE